MPLTRPELFYCAIAAGGLGIFFLVIIINRNIPTNKYKDIE